MASSQIPVLAPGDACEIEFGAERVKVYAAYADADEGPVAELKYADVDSLTIGGQGAQTRTTGGRMIGGGLGVQGALEGMAVAALVNSVTTKKTTTIDTTIYLRAGKIELLMSTTTISPEILKVRLSPSLTRIKNGRRPPADLTASAGATHRTSIADELQKIAELHKGGVLSKEEFSQLKFKILNA